MKSKAWKNDLKCWIKTHPYQYPRLVMRAIVIDINRLKKEPVDGDSIAGKAYEKADKKYEKARLSCGCKVISYPLYKVTPNRWFVIMRDMKRNLLLVKPAK